MLDRLHVPRTPEVLRKWPRVTLRRAGYVVRRVPLPRAEIRRRALSVVGVIGVALLGAWLGILVGGQETTPVGPVSTHMAAKLSWSGDTDVKVGPLGTLHLDTHDGPLGVSVSVEALNVVDAQKLVNDPNSLNGLSAWVSRDLKHAVIHLVIRSAVSGVAGGVLLSVLVYRRRWRRIAAVGVTSAATVLGTFGVAAATWNPRAVSEPTYTGLLANAPALVGNAKDIVAGFSSYSQELAKLVGNVSKLYDVTSTLPGYQPDSSTIRVLQVSDIHLNPAAWNVIRSVSQQFAVQVIVDSGDVSDHGSSAEERFTKSISTLKVPYVFIRGNHDSLVIQQAVAANRNAVVLDNGQVREVAGLRFTGDGDPRFTPDKTVDTAGEDAVMEEGRIFAGDIEAQVPRPDVAIVHDPVMAKGLDGLVPLVLAGHLHKRSTQVMALGTRLYVEGSTGGAGLRALEGAAPTPIECTVFYFDAATKKLQAWDDVTLGGLGLASAQISRTLAPETVARLNAPKPTTAPAAAKTKPRKAPAVPQAAAAAATDPRAGTRR
ncbi:MAG TPA: metallophosphoesterase [Sporichthyaceae bacterium]|nr:metallophosphoesterase [Sporichthyaceae bacterium]